MRARSSSVKATPEIHSACFTISAVTFGAPAASAESARPKTAAPGPRPREDRHDPPPVPVHVSERTPSCALPVAARPVARLAPRC